jgi:hypothetical protein
MNGSAAGQAGIPGEDGDEGLPSNRIARRAKVKVAAAAAILMGASIVGDIEHFLKRDWPMRSVYLLIWACWSICGPAAAIALTPRYRARIGWLLTATALFASLIAVVSAWFGTGADPGDSGIFMLAFVGHTVGAYVFLIDREVREWAEAQPHKLRVKGD